MFNVIKHSSNRMDIEISGKLDGDEISEGLDSLIAESISFRNGRMLYRITDFEFPAFTALALKFSRIPQLFKLISRFDKVAVVADKNWVRRISEIESVLIPGICIRAFDVDQHEQAAQWLTE